ncbi:monofunctional biosynthetic peptidoglycan transglycosylase [Tamlana sp. 2_MG-2023]|uniref:monofunctional biosynthetic peptidoglycan transglycosylase n=1 Tax=unclassified Tamlana TaxID=2614803 RepID=UPI0026E35EAD|nr:MULTISPECIES: monofunctional biosynthetic peptidoglycan transglycosylase [unclassified Tamlana]MDO6759639.1 monofunctional biosynthetic peptidoglycan transglycosylase [Tamlana sp. 2_MG-2023]MDO6791262.1 monofunctional biosynthetic peptidoglycan transglycosylase [Tamlana sp. 1_MG-2023]
MKGLLRFLLKICFWFVVLSLGLVLLFKWVPVPFTPLMAIRYFEKDSKKILKHDWVSMDAISKNLQLAVICSEDQNFLKHNGFDYKAIEKAITSNNKGKRLKGGSTISQQTAKNVFLWPDRSWVRKGFEAYFTFLIELCWSKERTLEVYLNSIEMGNGIYGAEAASQYWFKKPAKNLTKYEAAAIAAILPSPRKYKASPATAYIQSRKAWIVKQMSYFGTLKFEKKDHGKGKH